jgi:excisionase family DNA binding protein
MAKSLEPLLTIAEVAESCQVSQRTVRRWIDSGDLPAYLLGRLRRIAPKNLRIFLKLRRR